MAPFPLRKTTLACLCALTAAELLPSTVHAETVPAGFEDIVAGHEERVEVDLLGKSLGLFSVFVTPETVRFEHPQELLDALAGQADLEKHGEQIADALSREMARNGNLACQGTAGVDGCGYVETASAAVIYDESNGALNLFLASGWLAPEAKPKPYHTLSASIDNALIHAQTINLSGGRGYRSLSIAGTGALGITPQSFIGGNWNFSHTGYGHNADTHVDLQDLYYRHDLGAAHYAQVGRMDNRNLASALGGNFGFTMLPTGMIDGMRVGTTLAYLDPAAAQQGTPVTLLLPRDARVDAYRGNELLGTFYLKAGVNPLDTSRFPAGSYPLSLRVFENGVQVRTQVTPFSKTGGGVGDRSRQWFVQAGRLADPDPGKPSGLAAATGVRVPLPGGAALTSGLASVRGRLYNETSVEWSHGFSVGTLSMAASYFRGSDGSRGNTQQVSFTDGISFSVYRYQMRGAACHGVRSDYRDIGCYDTLNATISAPIASWSALVGYTYNKSVGHSQFGTQDMTGAPWLSRPVQTPGDRVSRALQLGLSRSDTWHNINFNTQLGLFTNRGGGGQRDYGGYVGVTLTFSKPASAERGASVYSSAGLNVRSEHRRTTTNYTLDRNYTWQGDTYRELDLSLSGYNTETFTGQVQGRWNGRYGDVQTAVANSYARDQQNSPSVTASYASTFAVAKQGLLLGASSSQTDPIAGFAVRVEKRDGASGMAAEARTSASQPVRVGFGQRALLPVTAFTPVTTEVEDAGTEARDGLTSVTEGLGKRNVFMTPGHLLQRSVKAKVIYTYVGQAVTMNGMPLSHSVILNGSVPPLDDDGGFVAEFDRREKELFVVDGPSLLRCPLHVERQQDVIMNVGTVRCEVAGPDVLPAELRKQARVQALLKQHYVMSMRVRGREPRGPLP